MQTTILFVSPAGDDRNDGSSPLLAAGSQGPLATPAAAQEVARRIGRNGTQPVEIRLAGGVYELSAPLLFTAADNGQVWRSLPGERAVLSGGRRLRGWRLGSHAGRNAWFLELPEVQAGQWDFTQLWVNGVRRPRPRLPKQGCYRFAGLDGQQLAGWSQGATRAQYAEKEIGSFRNLDDVQVVAYQLWFDMHLRLAQVDEARKLLHFKRPALGNLIADGAFARYELRNVAEALDTPGEWYLDRSSGVLTYLPLPGEDPEQTGVVVPRLPELVRFQGTAAEPVRGVRLEGLGLCHNEWSRGPENVGGVQAAFDVPGAVVFAAAEDCVLYACELAHCAGYGVEMLTSSHRNCVAACTIHDLGGGGVKIGHESLQAHDEAVGPSFSPAPDEARRIAATVIDCTIRDGSLLYAGAIGVWVGNAGANRILHNEICHFNYTGISVGWTWSYSTSSRGYANRIDGNHVHHINVAGLLDDNGGIYTLGLQPRSTIRGNFVHDVGSHGYGGSGIYPDEGSSGLMIENNCVWRVKGHGLGIHYASFLTVRNNLLVGMGGGILNLGREDRSAQNLFERNIIHFDHSNLEAGASKSPHVHRTCANLVWNASGNVNWPGGSLAQANRRGGWLDSREADPLLADPLGGDFRLRADSPALALGFVPFDWRQAGPRRPAGGTLPESFADYPLPPGEELPAAVAEIQVVATEPGPPGWLRVRAAFSARNVGTLPVAGVYTFLAVDCTSGSEIRLGETAIALARDAAPAAASFEALLSTDSRQCLLLARGSDEALLGAAVSISIPPRIALPRSPLPEPPDFAAWPGQALPLTLVHDGHRVFDGKAALFAGRLVLAGRIADPEVTVHHAYPWMASALELFFAAADDVLPRQFILTPPSRTDAAELRAYRCQQPEGTRFQARLDEGGWVFSMSVDLAALGVDPARFGMDAIFCLHSPIKGQNHLRLPLWGSIHDSANAKLLALLV